MSRLLAFGCSFTKDNYQKTWPDYLSDLLDLPLINLGARGAGLDYVSKRIIATDILDNDLVVIMLPSADRFDWYIDNSSPLQSHALSIASWQDGKQGNLLDLAGKISYESGFVLSGGEHRGHKKYWYKYFYSETKADMDYWHFVYLIQLHLMSKKCTYWITSAYDKFRHIEQDYNKNTVQKNSVPDFINFDKFIYWESDKGFLSFAKNKNYQVKDHHPVTEAHCEFAKLMASKIDETNY